MGKRLIERLWTGNIVVKVYKDIEWNEYTCVLFVNNKRMDAGTYFTSDKEDAIKTANRMLIEAFNTYKSISK